MCGWNPDIAHDFPASAEVRGIVGRVKSAFQRRQAHAPYRPIGPSLAEHPEVNR